MTPCLASPPPPPAARGGFTLLEILVVLAIVAMVALVATPRLIGSLETMQTKAATRDLVSVLRAARSSAIVSQRQTVITLNLDRKEYWIDGNGKPKRFPAKTQVTLFTATSERTSDHTGGIRFFPDGSSTGGRVTLMDERRNYIVDVDWLTGRVTVLD